MSTAAIRASLAEIWWIASAGLFTIAVVSALLGLSYDILLRVPFFVLAICAIYELLKRIRVPQDRLHQQFASLVIALLLAYLTPVLAMLFIVMGSAILLYVQRMRTNIPYSTTKNCPRCGREVDSQSIFCPNCSYDFRSSQGYSRTTTGQRSIPARRPASHGRTTEPIPSPPTQSNVCPVCNRNRLRAGQDICDECGRKLVS